MNINLDFFLFLILIKYSFPSKCTEGENFCLKCDNKRELCIECKNEAFNPNKDGGCIGIKKCNIGENYCNKCNIEGNLCELCDVGYFPDNNGGCSYIDYCDISYKGFCFKCIEDFILIGIGEEFKYCKSIYSNDFKNCKTINEELGFCKICEDSFFLGEGDYKCTKTENCYTSNFGTCKICKNGYYLNKKNDTCLLKENQFRNCQESIDGVKCEICDKNYFLSEDYYCIKTNFCSEAFNYNCIQCINNYFLAEDGNCAITENCLKSNMENGLCKECIKNYYLDLKDEKCKSNEIDEEYKFCSKFNEICKECISNYFIGEDNRCSTTKNCAESKNGICLYCSDNYILINDNKCIDIQNCASINEKYECIECNENYLLVNKTCKIIEDDKFENYKWLMIKERYALYVKMIFILIKQIIYAIVIKNMGNFINVKHLQI